MRRVSTPAALILLRTETSLIEIGAARERILFKVSDLSFDALGVATDRANRGHRVHVGAVGKFDGRVLGLHAAKFTGIHAGEVVRAVLGAVGLWTSGNRC